MMLSGRPDDALTIYEKMLEKQPDDVMAKQALARHYFKNRQVEQGRAARSMKFSRPNRNSFPHDY